MDNIEIISDIAPVMGNAVNAGIHYINDNKSIKTFVLGISGGLDSAVTAAIARMVCDRTNTRLMGVYLIIDGNTIHESLRAKAVGKVYCHDFQTINLNTAFYNTMEEIDSTLYKSYSLTDTHEEKVRAGNIKARLRMMYLYNLASKYNGLVLSTDNLTEYFLGFWTLHGDVGDLGLIQNLWKSEIYMMGNLIGDVCLDCVNAIPTDGLGITNSDFDQLLPEWTSKMGNHIDAYRFIDDNLISMFKGNTEDNSIIRRYKATLFKRMNPANITRNELLG